MSDDTGAVPGAAEPGRAPRRGPRRWAVEGGRRAVVVAVVAAVLGGLSGIALGSWLSWRRVAPRTPDVATATTLAHSILPVAVKDPAADYWQHTFWNPYSENTLHGGTGARVGTVGFYTNSLPRSTDISGLAATRSPVSREGAPAR